MAAANGVRQRVIDEATELGWTHRRAPEVDTFEKDGEQLLVAWSVQNPGVAVSATRINGTTMTRVVDSSAVESVRCWLGSPWL